MNRSQTWLLSMCIICIVTTSIEARRYRYYQDPYEADRIAAGLFGGAGTGALIGAIAGGGRGAGIGAAVGAGVGLFSAAAANAANRQRYYEENEEYYDQEEPQYYEPYQTEDQEMTDNFDDTGYEQVKPVKPQPNKVQQKR